MIDEQVCKSTKKLLTPSFLFLTHEMRIGPFSSLPPL